MESVGEKKGRHGAKEEKYKNRKFPKGKWETKRNKKEIKKEKRTVLTGCTSTWLCTI